LIVEVSSPGTEKRDRRYKKVRYARHGVREYWIAGPKETIEIYLPVKGGFQLRGSDRSIALETSTLFPRLQFGFDDIFRAD